MSDVEPKSIEMTVSTIRGIPKDLDVPVIVTDGTPNGTRLWIGGKKVVCVKELTLKVNGDHSELHLVFGHFQLQLDGKAVMTPEEVKIVEWRPPTKE